MTDKNDTDENVDSDEEDYEIYFLQPASSPYNIKEKLEAANKALFEGSPILETKTLRIKFREELVDYEPDLTDDDVQSIESYNEVEYLLEQEYCQEIIVHQPSHKIELNIFTPTLNITEEEEEYEENGEEDKQDNDDTEKNNNKDDDSLEQINADNNDNVQNQKSDTSTEENIEEDEIIVETEESDVDSYENNYSEEILDTSNTNSSISNIISDDEIEEIEDMIPTDDTESKETSSTKTVTSTTSSKKTLTVQGKRLSKVECKAHCIERLDSELDLTISKLQINEKPLCPTLKLIKRKCCEENHAKNDQKLPSYSGLRSEYGLSLQQLEKRQKRRELLKMREEKRKRLIEEYKNRKIQQNEEIFSQWLKDIHRRKQEQAKKRENKKMISPKILNIPNKSSERLERPKTSYPLIPSHSIKKTKRPNTSTACVYIQVPHTVLKQGLHLGDIIVSNSKAIPSTKGLHVLSIS